MTNDENRQINLNNLNGGEPLSDTGHTEVDPEVRVLEGEAGAESGILEGEAEPEAGVLSSEANPEAGVHEGEAGAESGILACEAEPIDFHAIIFTDNEDLEEVTDPIRILNLWMEHPQVNIHGPEHHVLDGAALLVALDHWLKKNPKRAAQLQEWRLGQAEKLNRGIEVEEDLTVPAMNIEEAVDALIERAGSYPGGACGFMGVCGAAVSVGAAFSIFSVTTPFSDETWSQANELTGQILTKLSTSHGPRCCKRNAYMALEVAADFLKKKYQIDLEPTSEIKCEYFDQSEECLFSDCEYF